MSTTMAYDIYDPGFADVTKFGNSTCCRFQWRTLKQRLQNQASFSFLCFSRDDPNFNCKFCMLWISFWVTVLRLRAYRSSKFYDGKNSSFVRCSWQKAVKPKFGICPCEWRYNEMQKCSSFGQTLQARASTEKPKMWQFVRTKWILNPRALRTVRTTQEMHSVNVSRN